VSQYASSSGYTIRSDCPTTLSLPTASRRNQDRVAYTGLGTMGALVEDTTTGEFSG
jgi:hypothetical protein